MEAGLMKIVWSVTRDWTNDSHFRLNRKCPDILEPILTCLSIQLLCPYIKLENGVYQSLKHNYR